MVKNVKLFISGNTESRSENDLNKDNIYINQKTMTEDNNKKQFLIRKQSSNNLQIFAVCSSTGENHHGVTASSITMQLLKILQMKLQDKNIVGKEKQIVEKFTQDLNQKILLYKKSADCSDITVTIAVVIVLGDKAFTAHIGDCRVYYYNSKYCDFMQITTDHLQANNLVNLGILKEEQALIHRSKSHLEKYIGQDNYEEKVLPDFSKTIELQKDDIVILTTDGITDYISNDELKKIIEDQDPNIDNKINKIFKKVKNEGQEDDASIIIFQVEQVIQKNHQINEVNQINEINQIKEVNHINQDNQDSENEEGEEYEIGDKLSKILPIILGALVAIIIIILIITATKKQKSEDVLSPVTKEESKDKIDENNKKNEEQQKEETEDKLQENNKEEITEEPKEENEEEIKEKAEEEIKDEDTNEIPQVYTVKQGDTLFSICMKFYNSKEPMEKLKSVNNIVDSMNLEIGQVIKLPAIIHDPINNKDLISIEYIVEKGDTLYSISMKIYKTSNKVKEIMDLNNIQQPEKIIEGMVLQLP